MWRRVKFYLETYLQRGAGYQLLLIALLIGLVAGLGGSLALLSGAGFANLGEASWWAFLRLTDPGYLGDDEGTLLRIISAIITVLGYVLFMGSLIAILTQWLNQTLRTLERGLTPIVIKDHILILGWTNRTPSIIEELMHASGRLRRFLQRHHVRFFRIVVLTQEVTPELTHELRTLLGEAWNPQQLIFRSGSSLNIEHLQRVNALEAAAIIVPGADFALGGAKMTDARVVKTLMSLKSFAEREEQTELPPIITEIFDAQKVLIATQAYSGQANVIASNSFISRLTVQNVRTRGLFLIYNELLSHSRGNEIYVRSHPDVRARPWSEVVVAFPRAIVIGVVRPEKNSYQTILNPPSDFIVGTQDDLVLIAPSFEDTALRVPAALQIAPVRKLTQPAASQQRKVLILGWSHKAIALIQEFNRYHDEQLHIDLMSLVPAAERDLSLSRLSLNAECLVVQQLEGDYTLLADLQALALRSYDDVIFLGSDWLESDEASDARTALGYVLVRSLLAQSDQQPDILVELMDPANDHLFTRQHGDVIISPLLLSHILAHSALRRELSVIFEALLAPDGAGLSFRSAQYYGVVGQRLSRQDLQRLSYQHGETFVGLRLGASASRLSQEIHLNPLAERQWLLTEADEVIILATSEFMKLQS